VTTINAIENAVIKLAIMILTSERCVSTVCAIAWLIFSIEYLFGIAILSYL
jgi:hypothetical protein